jgi:predicted transcriptional regulator
MMTLGQIRDALSDLNLTKVTKTTGVNYHTITRLANDSAEPDYETVRLIVLYLQERANLVKTPVGE